MRYDTREGEEPVVMKHSAGRVAVRFRGAPPVDGKAREGALVTSIELDGLRWTPLSAVYVDCPMTLASGLDALCDSLGGSDALAVAALTELVDNAREAAA